MKPARLACLGVALVVFSSASLAGEPPVKNPPPRPAATPIIAAPADGGSPIIAVSGSDKPLADQLAAALKDKSQLATELTAAWKETEQLKAQLAQRSGPANELTAAQKNLRETQTNLARQTTDLATTRAETAAARIEVSRIGAQLTTAREQLAAAADAKARVETALAATEQIAVARAEDLGKLRAAATAQELATMRDRASATRELETRVRQLEGEKAALAAAATANPGVNPDEFARATKALADTEAKLATALRSYTLLATERDELRGQMTDLAAKLSAAEARAIVLASTPAPGPRTAPIGAAPVAATAPSRPPAASLGGTAANTHVITVGDTLATISRRYYGTPNRWTEILAANRDILIDERSLVAGKILRIP